MEQFTPKPSPQTESRHNDGSTYIPTEDEIDAMDTIGKYIDTHIHTCIHTYTYLYEAPLWTKVKSTA